VFEDAAKVAANVRAAAGPEPAGATAPTEGSRPAPPDTIESLLSVIAAGRAGDRLAARLEAVLERNDEAVAPALALVRGDKPSKLVMDALASAGTPVAQAGLGQLALDGSLREPVRREVVASLALVQRPAPPTLRTIERLLATADPGLHHAALFTAAALVRVGRRDAPASAARIERAVLAECGRAPGDGKREQRLDALAALGNLGSPAILPRVRSALGNPDPGVRAAAARALRFVPDAEADRLLLATLRRDRDPTVRAAALFAAGFRPLEPLADGLSETAESDPVEYVRANAVALLSRGPGASQRAVRALAFVAHNDPAPAVRRLAREAEPAPRAATPDAEPRR
jgi:HEAT repeat protein